MTGPAISQNFPSRDSSFIANKDLKKAAVLIEQGKGCKEELRLQIKNIDLLNQRIDIKDSIINAHQLQGKAYESIIGNYKQMQVNYEETMVFKDKQYAKAIRKQKTKTVFITLLSALAVGYLLTR